MDPLTIKAAEAVREPGPTSAFESQTFSLDMSIRVNQPVGSMSISPSGRDVVLASRQGLHIIDLDAPYSPPRHLPHRTPWEVADVQWSPFSARDYWVVSTSNQKALVWNLNTKASANAIEHVLHAHRRAITDINFSAHHPDILATCAVDSFVHTWDLRSPARPVLTYCDWFAGATQVKWNRQDPHIIASSHDKFLRIWDDRKGAYPLRSIEAHNTKIYGIDWNRTRSSGIVTCSLDKSIKFWDYYSAGDSPERVIRTPFPVWRARHTPFGWGMLAMPQREDTDLHLYDRRLSDGVPRDGVIPPVHKYEGHEDQVKEFLWRPRGGVENGIDHREFQLVTWGADRDLRLHHVDETTLERVGYRRGQAVRANLNITRRDAIYRTFRDERPASLKNSLGSPNNASGIGSGSGVGLAIRGAISAGMKKAPIPLSKGWGSGGYTISSIGMQAKQNVKRGVNAIDWMKGIRIGKKEVDRGYGGRPMSHDSALRFMSWESPESLGDEITQVADKYKKVTFDRVEVQKRSATFSMNGPWGVDGNVVYLKVNIRFPSGYPESLPPTFELEKTSSIPQEVLNEVTEGIRIISQSYVSKGRGCLEAVSSYLLGERDLEESTAWLLEGRCDQALDPDTLAGQISSDDEEDNIGIGQISRAQDLENSGTDLLGTTISNANVPLPKACGATFAQDGRLICFFPAKNDRAKAAMGRWFSRDGDRLNKTGKTFAGFGRLETGSPETKVTILSSHEDQEGNEDSADDSFTSSSGSSSSSEEDLMEPKLGGFPRWRQRRPRDRRTALALSTDNSQLSVGQGSSNIRSLPSKPKNIVSIYRLDDMIPAKKVLAEEYMIFGDGPSVCQHNARVAGRHGFRELADFWEFAELILHNQVPLEMIEQPDDEEPIFVMARRANGSIKRKDSGLDLAYDYAKAPSLIGHLTGRTRWGEHPIGGHWLVEAIFEHFEKLADVQMLAMLSCVFTEPVTNRPSAFAMMDMSLRDRALPMKVPAFSLDYYPSVEMAWSLQQPTISVPPTPKISHTPVTTYGSAGSSIGQWGRDLAVPYSTGTTPPSSFKNGRASLERTDSQTQSLSTSPERQHGRRSNASLTSVSLSRGIPSVSRSSPPIGSGKRRSSPVHSTAGSLAPGGVTWGTNTFFAAPLDDRSMASSAAYSDSETEEEEPPTWTDGVKVKVTMKNQDMFDGEGCASTPLLERKGSLRYKGYRESYANLLAVWQLEMQRLEILKLNGLETTSSSEIPNDHHSALLAADNSEQSPSEPQSQSQPTTTMTQRRQQRRLMACTICNEVIQGTYAPCFACGHITHSHCHQTWFIASSSSSSSLAADRECPTGCGCRCSRRALSTPRIIIDEFPPRPPRPPRPSLPALADDEDLQDHHRAAGNAAWQHHRQVEDDILFPSG